MNVIVRNLVLVSLLLTAAVGLVACDTDPTAPAAGSPPPSELQAVLDEVAQQQGIPGLAAVTVQRGRTERAATGLRRLGAGQALTPGDLLYLGSNAKAVAATVLGRLVERGVLAWDALVIDVFPELQSSTDPGYRTATLEQLLSHRTGAPGLETAEEIFAVPPFAGDARQQRVAFTAWVLAQPPPGRPGEFQYSNAGYAMAAAMAERRAGRDWESLVRDLLCAPLGMQPAFGWPAALGAAQPWGHLWDGQALIPFDPDGPIQFPGFLTPAGHFSLTLDDYAAFLKLHLRGLCGGDGLLEASTIQKLHTPIGGYALGWAVLTVDGDVVSIHDGSDDTFTCLAVIDPARDLALAVIANAAHPGTEQGLAQVMGWALARAGLGARDAAAVLRTVEKRASCVAD